MTRSSRWGARILTAVAFVVIASAVPRTQGPSLVTPEDVTLRLIVVESSGEASRIVDRLRAGERFVDLARAASVDPSADAGGLLGRVRLDALRPELRQALHGLAVGAISDIVRIPTGFAVLTVEPGIEGEEANGVGRAVAATGSVKYVMDVSGFAEASLVLHQYPKPEDWNLDPRTICRLRTQSLAEAQRHLEQQLASGTLAAGGDSFTLVQAHFVLAQLHAYHGRMAQSVELFEQAHAVAESRAPTARLQTLQALGIAHLHKGEQDNGHYHAPGEQCLLGIGPGRPLARTADIEHAIAYFSRYLAERPDDLEVRWLLNIAHMAAGTYPHGVEAAHRIPPGALASSEDVGRFVDVAAAAGLQSVAAAGGVIVDDFDNDGRFEVVTSSMDSCQPMHFFARNAQGRFVERGTSAGLGEQLGGLNIVQADYDNDGFLDILLLRGGWEIAQRNSLLRNNGDGTFTDVTVASGLATPVTSTQAAVWTDVNNDGFLDLFVGNEGQAAQLFLNRRDGTFEDVAARAGVDQVAFSKGVAAADYDNDGWPDLYVSNLGGRNFLYRNNRDGTFTELGATAGVPGPGQGFATWFFDYDNDGWPDIFATSYFASVEETARTYLGLPRNANPLHLYRNLGNGRFEDVTQRVGLDKVFMPMGANFGDIDNDGFLDIYLGTGNPSYASLLPSVLLRNREGRSFVDVTASSGTGELHKGHGVAFADLDHDGDQEIVFEVGGATPGDAHGLRLFENPGHGNDWIAMKLVGATTNRSAIGARLAVTVEHAGQRRSIHRTVGSGGSFGASPLQQHIGLGPSARIVEIEVWWPASNTRQRFTDVQPNQLIQVTERADTYMPLPLAHLPLRPSHRHGTPPHDERDEAALSH